MSRAARRAERRGANMRPVVLAVAITGSVPRKKDNPALPVTPAEQIESTHQAFEAGATLVHIHVRNPDETLVIGPGLVRAGDGGRAPPLPRHDRAIFDRRARARSGGARQCAEPSPRHGFAVDRSVNFPTIIYENAPALVEDLATKMRDHDVKPEIEIFDLSHIHGARRLIDARPDARKPACAIRARRQERHALRGDACSTFSSPRRGGCCRRRPGRRPASAAFRARSSNGCWRAAAAPCAPALKTIFASTRSVSPRATPNWSRSPRRFAPGAARGRLRPAKRAPMLGLRAA